MFRKCARPRRSVCAITKGVDKYTRVRTGVRRSVRIQELPMYAA